MIQRRFVGAPMDLITFGYAEPEARSRSRDRMSEFGTRLGAVIGIDVGISHLPSYDRVSQLIHHGDIDIAWLSPIPLVSLARNKRVVPLVALQRDRLTHYRCAFVVPADSRTSTLAELKGKRPAWVDVQSASGFVLPRIELDAHGIDLRSLTMQRFYGSHEGVVRAVASGRADFGATYARIHGDKVVGPWTRTPGLSSSVRVLSTFGEVPPDAIAARHDLERPTRDAVIRGMLEMAHNDGDRTLLSDVFGAEELEVPRRSFYEPLRALVVDAYQRGLLSVQVPKDEAVLSAAATVERRSVPPDVATSPLLEEWDDDEHTRRRDHE